MQKRYSELIRLPTFEERFEYLKLHGVVGEDTFGYDRYLNQKFYSSREWASARNKVIVRDNGNDLGIKDRPITGKIYIHHINPIRREDLLNNNSDIFDLENLVCVSEMTHKAIHYGDVNLTKTVEPTMRTPFDTCPWKQQTDGLFIFEKGSVRLD